MISLVQWFFQQDDYENDYERLEKKYKTISSSSEERRDSSDRKTERKRDRQTDR